MNRYQHLMSIFYQEETSPDPNSGRILVQEHQRQTPFFYSNVIVHSKMGEEASIRDIIVSNSVTILFYGSPFYKKSQTLVSRLKKLQESSFKLNKLLDIVYIPLFTFQETALNVEDDFLENHGDWWMMGFQTWEAAEAVYMHGVDVVPSLVVIDKNGRIITESGQNDLALLGNDVLITWF